MRANALLACGSADGIGRMIRDASHFGRAVEHIRDARLRLDFHPMLSDLVYRTFRKARRALGNHEDAFLKHAAGVIHIGANVGQERAVYARHDLPVIWVEPIPEVYRTLLANIEPYPNQVAIEALLAETPGQECVLHVASNNGASSSVLPLSRHRELWPDVNFVRDIALTTTSLDLLMQRPDVDATAYDTLVMDTQGSELSVLRGGQEMLRRIRWVKLEAADFSAYEGCCTRAELEAFFRDRGFRLEFSERFASKRGVGNYFTLVFRRS